MSVGGALWAEHFERTAVSQVRMLTAALKDRLLPSFEQIEKEANDHAEEVFRDLGSQPASQDDFVDMADLAEIAQERGLARYEALSSVRQAILNWLTVSLYHLVEQELLFFLRRQVLAQWEEHNISLFKLPVLNARLRAGGIDVEQLNGWAQLKELALVANAIKHADGRSSEELKPLRPDLFVPPELRTTRFAQSAVGRSIYRPAAGDDLFVSFADFETYATSVERFLLAFADAIR